MSSSRVSLRGGGDVLSRRLASVRADILARGEVSFRVTCAGYPRSFVCKDFRQVVKAFARLRNCGFQQCQVHTIYTLQGLSVFGGSPETWLLLPSLPPLKIPFHKKCVGVSNEERSDESKAVFVSCKPRSASPLKAKKTRRHV